VANCLVAIGSTNAGFSLRHFFSYQERRNFIKKLFPKIKVVGLPDYITDEEWLVALDDILTSMGINPKNVIFFGGCEEDVVFFLDKKRKCKIMNRFDGTTPKISATEVRDCLIFDRPLDGMLNPKIMTDVKKIFAEKWEKFKKI